MRWAIYEGHLAPSSTSPTAAAIRTGKRYGIAPGEFETKTRTVDDHPRLYARCTNVFLHEGPGECGREFST